MTRTSNKGRKRKPLKKPEINNKNLKKNKNTTNTKKKNKNIKPQKTLTLSNKDTQIPHHSDSNSSDSDVPAPDKIVKLLEPYTKQQLVDFIIESAINDASNSLFNRIRDAADRDVSHRKIFVHGLGWDTTKETLISAFESCGEIEDCNVVTDRVTGKAKGFGFVLFKLRKGAMKSLKDPKKKINNRIVSCQLASTGPVGSQQVPDSSGRKIYVSNVHADTDSNKLRAFFEKFGEIETGPIGFDIQSGKSRGFALFVYKTIDGAKKVVEEPYKMFDGHQLNCQFASQGKNKVSAGPVTNAVQPVQAPVLAAVAAAQNMAMLSNYPSLNMNPMFGGLIGNPNAGLQPGAAGGYGQGVIGPSQLGQLGGGAGGYSGMAALHSQFGQLGGGAGGYGGMAAPHSQLGQLGGAGAGYGGVAPHGLGSLGGSQSLLGSYSTAPMLQGLQQAYPPSSQMGQTSTSRAGGSYSGYPLYRLWYDLIHLTIFLLFVCLIFQFYVLMHIFSLIFMALIFYFIIHSFFYLKFIVIAFRFICFSGKDWCFESYILLRLRISNVEINVLHYTYLCALCFFLSVMLSVNYPFYMTVF